MRPGEPCRPAFEVDGCDRDLHRGDGRERDRVGKDVVAMVQTRSAANAGLPSVSVLVVDADDDARELLASLIDRAGYSVITGRDGREALELMHSVRPDVILIELRMPIMSGAEFREIQRRDREWIKIPTVVMTGTSEEAFLDLAIEATLQKPVRAKDVLDLIARHTRRRT
jgi:CheY-like chemotaxis protein